MKKLILNISIMVLVVAASVVAIFFLLRNPNNPEVDFLNQRLVKAKRAVVDSSENRLLLVGGSNLAFGIISETVEEESGLSVHNLGLQRGLGLPYMLAEAGRVVRSGDKVVFSLEYDFFFEKELSGITPMLIVENDPNQINEFTSFDDLARISRFFPSYFRIKMNQGLFGKEHVTNEVYNKDAFNENGDVISHLDKDSSPLESDYNVFELKRTNTAVSRLNKWIEEHPEVECFFIYPSLMVSKYSEYVDEIKDLDRDLTLELNCKIIGNPSDAAFSDSDFFDTVYHLKGIARDKRSRQVARGVKDASLDPR